MNLENLLLVARTGIYTWIGVESLLLAFLYHFGYVRVKKSKVILSLRNFLFTVSLFFIFLSFLPLVRRFIPETYEVMVNVLALIGLFIGYYILQFREETLK